MRAKQFKAPTRAPVLAPLQTILYENTTILFQSMLRQETLKETDLVVIKLSR